MGARRTSVPASDHFRIAVPEIMVFTSSQSTHVHFTAFDEIETGAAFSPLHFIHRFAWFFILPVVFLAALPALAYAQSPPIQSEEQVVRGPDAGDDLGTAVALDGTTAVIGVPGDDALNSEIEDSGTVYVYERTASGSWTEAQVLRLASPQPDILFGSAVALAGDILLVGAPDDNGVGNDAGAVFVFEPDQSGTWSQVDVLRGSNTNANDNFGAAVAFDGRAAVIGAPSRRGVDDNLFAAGAAYTFRRATDGTWTEEAVLGASNAGVRDEFGVSVGIDEGVVVVGAHKEGGTNDNTSRSGAAYVFEQVGGSWVETALLRAPDAEQGDEFGIAVSIDGPRIAVGAHVATGENGAANAGTAYLFDHSAGAGWSYSQALTAFEQRAGATFGKSIDLGEIGVLVGAPGDDGPDGSQEFNSGAAYFFQRQPDGSFNAAVGLRGEATDTDDRAGEAVALYSDQAVVGAPGADGPNSNRSRAGAAYLYNDSPLPVAVQLTDGSTYTPPGGTPGTDENPVGRLEVEALTAGARLTDLQLSLQGTNQGVEAIRLFESADDAFDGSDALLSSVTVDPATSTPATVAFTELDRSISASPRFLFVAVDLTDEARGDVQASLSSITDVGIADGAVSTEPNRFPLPLSGTSVPLPVELTSFEAIRQESGIVLTWTTASETKNTGFSVQRQVNDGPYRDLAFVEGAGTTTDAQSYRFADDNLPFDADSLRYRLRQLDADGTVEMSRPVSVHRPSEAFRVRTPFPNPVRDRLRVNLIVPERSDVSVEVFDVLGRSVMSKRLSDAVGRMEATVNVASLPSGTYVLRVGVGNRHASHTITVVK